MASSRFVEIIDTDGYLYGAPSVRFTIQVQIDSWQDGHTWKLWTYTGAYPAAEYCDGGTWEYERVYLEGSGQTMGRIYLLTPTGKRFCELSPFGSDYFLWFPTGMEVGDDGSGVLMLKGKEGRVQPNVVWHVVSVPVYQRYVWFGCGSKLGAIVGVSGEEEGMATLHNGADRSARAEIKYRVKRTGGGLGGSAGGFFGVVTGCLSASQMVGVSCGGWDFSLAALASFDGVVDLCRSKGYLQIIPALAKVLSAGGTLGEEEWGDISNLVKIMLGASSMNHYSKGFSTFDIPLAGYGTEISFFWAEGSIIKAKAV